MDLTELSFLDTPSPNNANDVPKNAKQAPILRSPQKTPSQSIFFVIGFLLDSLSVTTNHTQPHDALTRQNILFQYTLSHFIWDDSLVLASLSTGFSRDLNNLGNHVKNL